MGPEMLFLLLKALISITAPFSPTRICFGPVLALSSALSLQSSLSKSIDIERPIRGKPVRNFNSRETPDELERVADRIN